MLPLFLDVRGKPCLVLGGGRVALRKVQRLLEAGAEVTVVSPEVCDSIEKLCKVDDVAVKSEQINLENISIYIYKYFLVLVCTDDLEFNRGVAEACREAGVLVNSATAPEAGDVFFGAESGTERLRFAVSTAGSSPLAARWFARWVARQMPRRVDAFLEKLYKIRTSGVRMGEIGSKAWKKVQGLDWMEEIRRDGGKKIISDIKQTAEKNGKIPQEKE